MCSFFYVKLYLPFLTFKNVARNNIIGQKLKILAISCSAVSSYVLQYIALKMAREQKNVADTKTVMPKETSHVTIMCNSCIPFYLPFLSAKSANEMLRQSRVSWDKMPVLQFTVLFALLHKVFR
jgi:hypothetical protein